MEQESFFSGYCRVLDSSRTVAVVVENGVLTEADCNFTTCIYAASCPIGQQIESVIK